MTLHIYRTHVAGFFGELDDATRSRLLDEVDQHDAVHAAFRPEGTITYDRTLRSFRFRYEIRETSDTPEEAEAAMVAAARDKAMADLARLGVRGLDPDSLRIPGTDMASVWRR